VLEEILKTSHSKAIFILDVLMEKYVSMLRKRNKLVVVCSPADYASTLMRPALKVYSKIKGKDTPSSNTASYHTICHLNKTAPKVENNGDEIAVFLHGGGTTGKSKTIQLTSKNLNELAYKLSFLMRLMHPVQNVHLQFYLCFTHSVSELLCISVCVQDLLVFL
jgi:long-subunit acyl-CoA synthetase (AMP-forming)